MENRIEVQIPDTLSGGRLDKALAALLPEFSRARLQALLAEGCVTDAKGRAVTGGKGKVYQGEVFTVRIPPPTPRRSWGGPPHPPSTWSRTRGAGCPDAERADALESHESHGFTRVARRS